MRTFLIICAAGLLFGLLSCKGESGSSDGPGLAVAGGWGGDITPDDAAPVRRFRLFFETDGDVTTGATLSEVTFTQVFGVNRNCPERLYDFAGTLRGVEMDAVMNGTLNKGDSIELELEFLDDNTAIGTYVYTATKGACLGQTGTIQMTRNLPI